jgi:hypothetical protein
MSIGGGKTKLVLPEPEQEEEKKPAKKDGVTLAMEKLAEELERQHSSGKIIKREGNQVILPTYMSNLDAIAMLKQLEKENEEPQKKVIRVKGHPSDCLWNFAHAMQETFGHVLGGSNTIDFFGMKMTLPGETRTIKTSYTEQETVPYNNIVIPGLPVKLRVGFEDETLVPNEMFIIADYPKKFQSIVEEIERRTLDRMKTHSIFRGKAINSRWEFINLNGFPLHRIAYAEVERAALHANVFRLLESTKEVEKMGVPLKRTVLLHGRFGTGKTLTALKTANLAVANNWTFINVLPGDDIVKAIELAKLYTPCVVFFEDIDHVTNMGRDANLNQILNTVDGLLSKSAKVMVILTTNHVDRIEQAMMRPGRIDQVIELGAIDGPMIEKLIRGYVGDALKGELDIPALLQAAEGYTPAFVAEGCHSALLYALDRTSGTSTEIHCQDVIQALKGLRSQFELMTAEREQKITLDDHLRILLSGAIAERDNGKGVITLDVLRAAPAGYKAFTRDMEAGIKALESRK